MSPQPSLAIWIVLGVGVAVATAWDLARWRIPNFITVLFLAAGLGYQVWAHKWSGLATGVLGAAAGVGLLIVFFAVGGLRASDVKLLAGVGAWLGPQAVFVVFLVAAILGALATLVVSWWTGQLSGVIRNRWVALRAGLRLIAHVAAEDRFDTAAGAEHPRRPIPYGALVGASLAILLAYLLVVRS